MIGELFGEVAHEITAEPVTFAVEVVQFGLLVLIVKSIAMGFGKRKGFVVNMLQERRQRVAAALDAAAGAESALARAREEAEQVMRAARDDAAAVLLDARVRGHQALRQSKDDVEREASEIRERADRILEAEFAEMHSEVRDQLVGLVADATRAILNEAHTPSEQRAIVQHAVLRGIEGLEDDGEESKGAVS